MTQPQYPPEVLWLQKNASMLNIYQIEIQLGMVGKTIHNTLVKDLYRFNEKWWPAVISWVRSFVDIGVKSGAGKAAPAVPDRKKKSVRKPAEEKKTRKKAENASKTEVVVKPKAKELSIYLKSRQSLKNK